MDPRLPAHHPSSPLPTSPDSAHLRLRILPSALHSAPYSLSLRNSPPPRRSPPDDDEEAVAKKKKNADAQAAFRQRRQTYIKSLEETVTQLKGAVTEMEAIVKTTSHEIRVQRHHVKFLAEKLAAYDSGEVRPHGCSCPVSSGIGDLNRVPCSSTMGQAQLDFPETRQRQLSITPLPSSHSVAPDAPGSNHPPHHHNPPTRFVTRTASSSAPNMHSPHDAHQASAPSTAPSDPAHAAWSTCHHPHQGAITYPSNSFDQARYPQDTSDHPDSRGLLSHQASSQSPQTPINGNLHFYGHSTHPTQIFSPSYQASPAPMGGDLSHPHQPTSGLPSLLNVSHASEDGSGSSHLWAPPNSYQTQGDANSSSSLHLQLAPPSLARTSDYNIPSLDMRSPVPAPVTGGDSNLPQLSTPPNPPEGGPKNRLGPGNKRWRDWNEDTLDVVAVQDLHHSRLGAAPSGQHKILTGLPAKVARCEQDRLHVNKLVLQARQVADSVTGTHSNTSPLSETLPLAPGSVQPGSSPPRLKDPQAKVLLISENNAMNRFENSRWPPTRLSA